MTDNGPFTTLSASIDRVENDVVAELAARAAAPTTLDPRGLYLAVTADGGRTVIDITETKFELDSQPPVRKQGTYRFGDPDDFIEYLDKHKTDRTELWGDDKASTITAVIDAHSDIEPGHEKHTAVLALPYTKDWKEWVERDGKYSNQMEFAEFIEDHLPNFVTPDGATMLELAQSFQATNKVDFESSQRVNSGETQLTYTENVSATAGKKGALAIPDTFQIGIQVHERGPAYRIEARFRYRINGGDLMLGYRLTRIDDVRRAAFDEVAARIEATGRLVWHV
ncbi:MAG: DUF2303 family protein [bacterium]|nr:DUF2303 family protein [bacterium]